jgi:integrase
MDRSHRSEPAPPAGDAEQLALFDLGVDMAALRKLRDRLTASSPENTRLALDGDWRHFLEWCVSAGRRPLPATSETVELYAVHCATELQHRTGTIERRLWAIQRVHKGAGHPSPVRDSVREVMSGLARERGRAQRPKAAITVPELRRMVATLDGRTFAGARDRAILLVGFSVGVRSAELAALRLQDVRILKRGAEVQVGRGKNDQEGRGRVIGVMRGSGALGAVGALENWIRRRGAAPGPLFDVSPKWIWCVVKAAAKAAGLDARRYGSHSLRAGMITALDEAGHSLPSIMARSGHRSFDVVSRYVRRRDAFVADPLAKRTGTHR